ncbi:MAG: glucose-1-phosphate thymidylyltransferase [Trueperaceae bacterium]|nr:MAG: glucose-1-phosphate thymidylyltransferase [Trueperaceae bacterium]
MHDTTLKGLILAAGLGTRLRPITSLRPKPTICVANKPLIHYAIDDLVDAGVREVGIVVSHDTIEHLEEAVEGYRDVRYTFVLQDPPKGLAHAVEVSRDFLGDDSFVMYLGDNLFEHGITPFVDTFRANDDAAAVLALVRVDDPRAFGVAVIEDGRITRLVEKPKDPPSDLAVAGVYVFDARIHDAIEGLEPGAKGEYQITDAIARLIERGHTVLPQEVGGWWKDTGQADDILDANRLELLSRRRKIEGTVEDSNLVGDVVVASGAVVRRSTVFGPALIGTDAVVEDAYVGPFTSLGEGVRLRNAEVEYAVVGKRSEIADVDARIQGSLIGDDVVIKGATTRPSTHRLIVGDMSTLELQQ